MSSASFNPSSVQAIDRVGRCLWWAKMPPRSCMTMANPELSWPFCCDCMSSRAWLGCTKLRLLMAPIRHIMFSFVLTREAVARKIPPCVLKRSQQRVCQQIRERLYGTGNSSTTTRNQEGFLKRRETFRKVPREADVYPEEKPNRNQ